MFLLCSIVLSYLHQQVSPVNPCLSTILLEPSGVSWGGLCSCWIAVQATRLIHHDYYFQLALLLSSAQSQFGLGNLPHCAP